MVGLLIMENYKKSEETIAGFWGASMAGERGLLFAGKIYVN
jgi:hypothetical protein